MNQTKVDGIKPDIVCYTMVLKGVIVEGDFGKADELFDELLVLGFWLLMFILIMCMFMVCMSRIVWKLGL